VANSQLSGPLLHSSAYMIPPTVPSVVGVPVANYSVAAGSSSAKSAGSSSYASFSSRRPPPSAPPARLHDSAHSILASAVDDERIHDPYERIAELTIQRYFFV
jgi:hypothetical protein